MAGGYSIGGIASGLDTATIVQQLMDIERQPIVRFQQRQAELRRVDGAWNEIITKVSAFRTALDKVRHDTDWSSFLSATSSNEAAAGAAATGSGNPGTLTFDITSLASRHQLLTSGTFTSSDALVGEGSLELRDNTGAVTATVTTTASTTLAELSRLIDDAGVGIDAQVLKVAEGDHRLMLQATTTGTASSFSIDATNLPSVGTATVSNAATDAVLNVAGVEVTRASNTITDLLEGTTITLKAPATGVTVATSRDTAKAADAVEAMVKAANDVLGVLGKHMAYNADTKVSGVLQGDPAARALAAEMRNVLSSAAGTGTVTHGSQIGLSLTRAGRVEVDRSALGQALADDFAGVSTFLVEGLGASLHGFLKTVEGVDGSVQRARDAIDGRIRSYDDQIEAFESRLEVRERTLRRQFTGLETALAKLQSQGQWLAGQLGTLGGSQ